MFMKKVGKSAPSKSAVAQPPKLRKEGSFQDHVPVRIQLPPDLLNWAEKHARPVDWYLSDLIRPVLEMEKFRENQETFTHVTIKMGGAK